MSSQSGRATLYKDKVRKLEAGNPPVCLNHKSEKDVYMASNAISDMLRLRKSQAKSQRKVV